MSPASSSRDSPLTNHGVLQTKRLGTHLVKRRDVIGPIKHIFTSNLQRAYQTAQAIADAQSSSSNGASETQAQTQAPLEVWRLPELREKDYGSSEGKKYSVKVGSKADSSVQSDSETHDAMRIRVDRFLDSHLSPVLDDHASSNIAIAIVAHGIILGVLLKALAERFPAGASSPVLQSGGSQMSASEFVAAWGNTGVLQAKVELDEVVPAVNSRIAVQSRTDSMAPEHNAHTPKHVRKGALRLTIELTNNVEHLEGLKKTRGGIGSAKFDSRQRTMDSFFGPPSKKRKLEDASD
ncbi:hypothetical protein AAE478_005787 [Parahypoxylon ruwenzoriense]